MAGRDDFGSNAGRPGGYGGGAGGFGNGGLGGGMGAGSRTGLTTGTTWHGNTAFGPAGGNVQAYGTRDRASLDRAGMGPTAGSYGNFMTPQGNPMFGGSPVQGRNFTGMNMGQALSQANRAQSRQRPEGLLGGTPVAVGAPAYSAVEQEMSLPAYENPIAQPVMGWLPGWPGTGQWWGDQAPYKNNSGLTRGPSASEYGAFKQGTDYRGATGIDPGVPAFHGPGSTYTQNGNIVGQNNMGAVRSGLRGNGGR